MGLHAPSHQPAPLWPTKSLEIFVVHHPLRWLWPTKSLEIFVVHPANCASSNFWLWPTKSLEIFVGHHNQNVGGLWPTKFARASLLQVFVDATRKRSKSSWTAWSLTLQTSIESCPKDGQQTFGYPEVLQLLQQAQRPKTSKKQWPITFETGMESCS